MSKVDEEHTARPPARAGIGLPRISGVWVLCSLVLTYVALPFLDQIKGGKLIESVLLTIVLCSAVRAVAADRRSVIWTIALATPALAGKWMNTFLPDIVPPWAYLFATVVCLGYIAQRFLRFIMAARRVNSDVLCSGIASFLILAMLWSFAYALVDRWVPGSFTVTGGPDSNPAMVGFTSLYFSMVTLCTVGYGDIAPVSAPARMLAMMEGATGVFFIAVMVARLMSIYSAERASDQR